MRLTAGGGIQLAGFGACPRSVGPDGCANAASFSRLVPGAPTGTLIAAFVDRGGAQVTAWAAVGDAAYVVIPSRAARLMLRINGAATRDYGHFQVSVDVVGAKVASDSNATSSPVHRLSVGRVVAPSSTFSRALAQNMMRRFGFSGAPADINALYSGGPTAWLTAQLSPSTIDDSALANTLEAMPTYTGNPAIDDNIDNNIQRRIVQREVASKRQLLEKMTLYWMEHFAVSQNGVNDIGAMAHYEDTIRADALGNFAQLVTDVSKEPAMLYWARQQLQQRCQPGVQSAKRKLRSRTDAALHHRAQRAQCGRIDRRRWERRSSSQLRRTRRQGDGARADRLRSEVAVPAADRRRPAHDRHRVVRSGRPCERTVHDHDHQIIDPGTRRSWTRS